MVDGSQNLSGKIAKISQMLRNNPINNLPVDFLIGMHGRVSKPNGFPHTNGGMLINHA